MNFSKFHILSVIAAGTALWSCAEEVDPQVPDTSEDGIVFNIEVSDPTEDGATLTITNNGKDKNTWYGFAYDDVGTEVDAAINRKVTELLSSEEGVSEFLERGSRRIRIATGLTPATKYRYVVFGLTSDGTVYGTPASCEFKTEHSQTTFRIEISDESATSVTFTVTPAGGLTEGWHCFVSDDANSTVDELIAGIDKASASLNEGKKNVSFTDLEPSKKYRAIVTGLDADGVVYGTPAELTFRLTPDAALNENWNVTYDGYVTPSGADKAYRKITNTSTDGERYFFSVISESNLASGYNNDINTYVKAAVEAFKTNYPKNWNNYVFSKTGSMYYTLRTRRYYYAFAIGIDKYGYFTGKFAISDKFYIEGKDWSDVYDKWIGRWEAVDNSGNGYNITVEEDSRTDYTLNITGWNGVANSPMHAVIDDETGKLMIQSYNYGKTTIETSSGTVEVTQMLVGQAGKYYYGISDDNSDAYYICSCELDSEGKSGTMKGASITTSSGTATFSKMFFIGVTSDNTVYVYSDQAKIPTFPCKLGRSGF